MTLEKYNPSRLAIHFRDEIKQRDMALKYEGNNRVSFIIGDVRDKGRMPRALDGIDYVVPAAATKMVPTTEYNSFKRVNTNINGAMNIIDVCIDCGVKRAAALLTDEAINPIDLYGATKLANYRIRK